jgi:tetratricopeptide (TPR) repeat protein
MYESNHRQPVHRQKQRRWRPLVPGLLLLLTPGAGASVLAFPADKHGAEPAQVTVHAKKPGCSVELDELPALTTDAQGNVILHDVEPGDHYLHARCPDEPEETAYFVTARPGQSVTIEHPPAATADSRLEPAEATIKLRELAKEAVQLRSRGQLDEAVQELREATKLDPENSDLHRELGITFLLNKDWKRARVEMLEAIRHDPTDADAHNGLGYALEKLGELDLALKEYRTATHLEPDDLSYRQHYIDALGKLAAQQGEKKK